MGSPALISRNQQLLNAVNESVKRLRGTKFDPAAQTYGKAIAEILPKLPDVDLKTSVELAAAAEVISSVMPGVASGVLLAVQGFNDGDTMSGTSGILDACASLAPAIGGAIGLIVGPEGLPVGAVVGAFIGGFLTMISDVLTFFAPKTESLATTIRNLLQDEKAEEVQSDIRTVHRSFLTYATVLNDACQKIALADADFSPGATAKVIDQLNFIEGTTISKYWTVVDWLALPKNQNHRLWPLILDGACNAYALLLVAVVRLRCIVSTTLMWDQFNRADAKGKDEFRDLWNSALAKLQVYAISNRLNLAQLRTLTPVLQNRGTLWRITRNFEVGVMDPNVPPVHHWGGYEFRKMSVTVCSLDQTLPEPVYQTYMTDMNSRLRLLKVSSYKTGAKKVADWAEDGGWIDGGTRETNDVYATPGTDLTLRNHACVYELSDGGLKIEGKYRDADGKVIGVTDRQGMVRQAFCTFPFPNQNTLQQFSITAMTSVRAVHDPYAYAEDTSNAHLENIQYIVYALEGTGRRIICLFNGQVLAFADPPGQISGIAVDQDYLWTFTDKEFACATHASIVHRAQPNQKLDPWIRSSNIPGAKGLHSIYPCDDGTIVAIVKETFEVYSAPYRVDLTARKMTANDGNGPIQWNKVGDCRAQALEKLPAFCWPQFESLTETLDNFQYFLSHKKQATTT